MFDGAINKHLAALNALKGSIEAEITIMIDLKRQIAEALTREAIRRSGRPDGMCNIAIVKQVELEFLERLEDKFVDVPEAASRSRGLSLWPKTLKMGLDLAGSVRQS